MKKRKKSFSKKTVDSKKMRKFFISATVFLAVFAIFSIVFYNIPAFKEQEINGTVLKGILTKKVVVSESQDEIKISPGEEYQFDLYIEYTDKNGNSAKDEVPDKSEVVMRFSNTSVCDRPSYDTIKIKDEAQSGTIFTVTLEYDGESSTHRFLIAYNLAKTVGSDEVVTNPDDLLVLVNRDRHLPIDYVPQNMVQPNIQFRYSVSESQTYMRSDAAIAIEKLFTAAKNDGVLLNALKAYSKASSWDPEHQTGLTIDVSSINVNYSTGSTFANSKEGKWLAENAYLYGFIIRYPEDKENVTGFDYDPSQVRYVGVELATYLYENNLALEEYFLR